MIVAFVRRPLRVSALSSRPHPVPAAPVPATTPHFQAAGQGGRQGGQGAFQGRPDRPLPHGLGEVRTAGGKLYLLSAIDRTSGIPVVRFDEVASRPTACQVLQGSWKSCRTASTRCFPTEALDEGARDPLKKGSLLKVAHNGQLVLARSVGCLGAAAHLRRGGSLRRQRHEVVTGRTPVTTFPTARMLRDHI